jgi:hypothetical protein
MTDFEKAAPMTDAVSALRAAAFHLFAPVARWEIDEGIGYVEAAIEALPSGTDHDLVEMIETLDWRLLERIADELESKGRSALSFSVEKDATRPPSRKRQRKPSLAAALKQAAKAGKPVKAATLGAEGVTLQFGKSDQSTEFNPWDEVLPREPH